jgi:hypothetical protein
VPSWLRGCGLTFHGKPERWSDAGLETVSRGQEFVTHFDNDSAAGDWLGEIIREIEA